MNQHVPDWDVGNDSRDLPLASRTLTAGGEDELVELLWQDGHVVMHSQTSRKAPITFNNIEQVQKPVQGQRSEQSVGNSSSLIQEDNPETWFQYPVDESLGKEFGSDFFSEMTGLIASGSDKIIDDLMEDREKIVKFGAHNDANLCIASDSDQHMINRNRATPPRPRIIDQPPRASFLNNTIQKFPVCSRAAQTDLNSMNGQLGKNGPGSSGKLVGQQSSVISVGSNNYGNKQIWAHVDPNHNPSIDTAAVIEDGRIGLPSDIIQTTAHESATSSSSGGSGYSIGRTGKQSGNVQNKKRKDKDVEDLECDSEEGEPDERIPKKPKQQTTSTRRSRAAEVHNLSERRRRDRINEKMKALQELIPHCNKTDKASMLDEAIEYLKSLQLQLQMMWMGSGMAPVMFPSMQQYMSAAMGMGMVYGPLPSMPNPVQFPGIPCINQAGASASTRNQTPMYPSPPLNAANFPIQVQNAYKGFHQMQPHPQATNDYTNWPFMMQQNNLEDVPSTIPHPTAGGASASEDKRSG